MNQKHVILAFCAAALISVAACGSPSAGEADGNGNITGTADGQEEITVNRTEYGSKELPLEGKQLEGLQAAGVEDAFYCNLEENIKIKTKSMEQTPVLMCKDPLYDITYYVNYGRDNYIYAYRNQTSELAVAIPARDLFCRKGELYFIADAYQRYQFSGFSEGNILKYNPLDGTVTVVMDCDADWLQVYADGICYRETGESTQETGGMSGRSENCYFFSFAEEKSVSFPSGVDDLRRWRGSWLNVQYEIIEASAPDALLKELEELGYTYAGKAGDIESVHLVDMQGTITETLSDAAGISAEYFIYGDFIYYIEQRQDEAAAEKRSVLLRYGMQDGSREEVAVLNYPTALSLHDMIFYQDVVYFGNGLRLEPESGAQCYMQNADGTSGQPEYFYTDRDALFCVHGGKLWRMEEQMGTSITVNEFIDGVPLEVGTYVYQLYEP